MAEKSLERGWRGGGGCWRRLFSRVTIHHDPKRIHGHHSAIHFSAALTDSRWQADLELVVESHSRKETFLNCHGGRVHQTRSVTRGGALKVALTIDASHACSKVAQPAAPFSLPVFFDLRYRTNSTTHRLCYNIKKTKSYTTKQDIITKIPANTPLSFIIRRGKTIELFMVLKRIIQSLLFLALY